MLKRIVTLSIIASLVCSIDIVDARSGSFKSGGFKSSKSFKPAVRPKSISTSSTKPSTTSSKSIYSGPKAKVSTNNTYTSSNTSSGSDWLVPALVGYGVGSIGNNSQEVSDNQIINKVPKKISYIELNGFTEYFATNFAKSSKSTDEDKIAYITLIMKATDPNKVYTDGEKAFMKKLTKELKTIEEENEKSLDSLRNGFLWILGIIGFIGLSFIGCQYWKNR